MPSLPRSCVICGAPCVPTAGAAAPVCGSVACQWTYRTTPAEQACGACRRPLTLRELAAGVCADPACQRAWTLGKRQERLRAVREAREERARREQAAFEAYAIPLRRAGARALRVAEPESFPVTRVPIYTGRTSRLPARRRRAFRQHLLAMLAEAAQPVPTPARTAPPFEEPAMRPELAGVFQRACGVCRGNCCQHAGERAYISPDTIRRYRAAHPAEPDEAVVAAYLAHVGARTYTDSCVYHAAGGCTLPRDMRAGICNRFYCGALRDYQDAHGGDEPVRAFFVAGNADHHRAAFVDVRDVRVVRHGSAPRER